MARGDVERRRRRDGDRELGALDVRIVGTPAVAGAAAEVMRRAGVPVRGPYPRRDEPGRVTYYANLPAGATMPAAGEITNRPAIAGPDREGDR
jgi:hypothetical protein